MIEHEVEAGWGPDGPDAESGVSPLEQRYRRVLRLLPASYRAVWADEMVATFLDGMLDDADADDADGAEFVAAYGRPSWPEVASVAALAARLRLGSDGGPARYVAWGRALRLAALIALFATAVGGLAGPGLLLWQTGRVPLLPRPPADWVAILSLVGLLTWVWQFAGLLWVAAFVALVTGHRRGAQVLAPIATLPEVAHVAVGIWGPAGYSGVTPLTWYALGLGLVTAVLPAAFHRGAPAVRALPWLLALPLAAAVVGVVQVVSDLWVQTGWLLVEWPGLLCIAFTVAAVASLAAARPGRTNPGGPLSHALALLAPLVLGYRLVSMWTYSVEPGSSAFHTLALAEAVGVSVTGAAVAVLAGWALRRLPNAADPAAWTASS
ncbi:MAG: hypothetical protein V7637_4138 [Mycobacteriales bacterium]